MLYPGFIQIAGPLISKLKTVNNPLKNSLTSIDVVEKDEMVVGGIPRL